MGSLPRSVWHQGWGWSLPAVPPPSSQQPGAELPALCSSFAAPLRCDCPFLRWWQGLRVSWHPGSTKVHVGSGERRSVAAGLSTDLSVLSALWHKGCHPEGGGEQRGAGCAKQLFQLLWFIWEGAQTPEEGSSALCLVAEYGRAVPSCLSFCRVMSLALTPGPPSALWVTHSLPQLLEQPFALRVSWRMSFLLCPSPAVLGQACRAQPRTGDNSPGFPSPPQFCMALRFIFT